MKKVILLFLILNFTYNPWGQVIYAESLFPLREKSVDYTQTLDIREGDFIFQHLPGKLLRVIADVTQSQYSHCGIIVKKQDGFYVLEAIGPVMETPLNDWIRRGIGHRITIVRLKEAYRNRIPKIIQAAQRFFNRPYDIQYEWDDEKIYCSELIYKASLQGAEIKLADFVKLGDLNWRPYESFVRYITGGDLPLEREMITPEDIVKSDKVDTIYSSFPPKEDFKVMAYDVNNLEGEWSGDYTFPGDQLIQVNIVIDHKGQIQQGQLASNIYIYPSNIKKFNDRTSEFKYIFYDNNGTKTVIEGRMDPTKDGVFGQWNDSRGYRGVFSLSKQETKGMNEATTPQKEESLQIQEYQVISGVKVISECDVSDLEEQEKALEVEEWYQKLVRENKDLKDEILVKDWVYKPLTMHDEVGWQNNRLFVIHEPSGLNIIQGFPKQQLLFIRQSKKERIRTNDLLSQLVASNLYRWQSYLTSFDNLKIVISAKNTHQNIRAFGWVANESFTYINEAVYRIYLNDSLIYTGYYLQPQNYGNSMAAFKNAQNINQVASTIATDIYKRLRVHLEK